MQRMNSSGIGKNRSHYRPYAAYLKDENRPQQYNLVILTLTLLTLRG